MHTLKTVFHLVLGTTILGAFFSLVAPGMLNVSDTFINLAGVLVLLVGIYLWAKFCYSTVKKEIKYHEDQ
jgi:hypothetical protein